MEYRLHTIGKQLNRRKQAVKATVIFIEKKHFFLFIFVSTIFNEKAYLT